MEHHFYLPVVLAFVNVTEALDIDALFALGARGIMGLAFDEPLDVSPIRFYLGQAYGNDTTKTLGHSPIVNLFMQRPDISNSFDVQLDRMHDLDEESTGTLLIAEHLPEFANITSQPKLPRISDGRWGIPCDGMKVNRQSFQFNKSSVEAAPAGKITVVLDTGYTFPPLPPRAVDAIYSSVPGAYKLNQSIESSDWLVPCDATPNVTFGFG